MCGTTDLQNKTLQTSVAFIEISLQEIWADAPAPDPGRRRDP
jgi:hypothetical protein